MEDSLGDRMKGYEEASNAALPRRMPIIVQQRNGLNPNYIDNTPGANVSPNCQDYWPGMERTHGYIKTLEGGHIVTPGDWIATGVDGEHWPIKPGIFAKTYTVDDGELTTLRASLATALTDCGVLAGEAKASRNVFALKPATSEHDNIYLLAFPPQNAVSVQRARDLTDASSALSRHGGGK